MANARSTSEAEPGQPRIPAGKSMASPRTMKTLATLAAAMTAVTMLLSWLEPHTVRLKPSPEPAVAGGPPSGAERLTPLSAPVATPWQGVELILAWQKDTSGLPKLPATHIIVWPDGRIETTAWWQQGRPLGRNKRIRICAIYHDPPDARTLARWLDACRWAASQMGVADRPITLAATPQTAGEPSQARLLKYIQAGLASILRSQHN